MVAKKYYGTDNGYLADSADYCTYLVYHCDSEECLPTTKMTKFQTSSYVSVASIHSTQFERKVVMTVFENYKEQAKIVVAR